MSRYLLTCCVIGVCALSVGPLTVRGEGAAEGGAGAGAGAGALGAIVVDELDLVICSEHKQCYTNIQSTQNLLTFIINVLLKYH